MQYFFIYSAGGGAGDWNGVKRIWKEDMSQKLKSNILLKFGDIFFNHKSSTSILRKKRWNEITNIRKWLYENVSDEFVYNNSNILLDSGTAKIVSYIDQNYNLGELSTLEIINHFKNIVDKNSIVERYVEIVVNSKINYAVTFDIPDPFKVRSSNNIVDRRRNILSQNEAEELMEVSAEYSNKIYRLLKAKIGEEKAINVLMPIVNGNWNKNQYQKFLNELEFSPKNIAIGGISSNDSDVTMLELDEFNLEKFSRVHFLGCGGLEKVRKLKEIIGNSSKYSVDVSTPINRSIDGSITGKSQSGIYSYNTYQLTRINKENLNKILIDYQNYHGEKIYNHNEFKEILDSILEHQNGNSSETTYNNRARLIFINSDIFRKNAEL